MATITRTLTQAIAAKRRDVAMLQTQVDTAKRTITALQELRTLFRSVKRVKRQAAKADGKAGTPRKRQRHLTVAQRKAISRRMRKYWATRWAGFAGVR